MYAWLEKILVAFLLIVLKALLGIIKHSNNHHKKTVKQLKQQLYKKTLKEAHGQAAQQVKADLLDSTNRFDGLRKPSKRGGSIRRVRKDSNHT